MENFWFVPVPLFLFVVFIFWKATIGPTRKEYGEKMWKVWGTRTYYWQFVILCSFGITFLLLSLLKWSNVLNF